jgi:8-oxo-dGTP pyrophosphatase MutT (NUDIX family)
MDPNAEPASPEARPAATVMLVRDASRTGLEVLMVKRNLSSDFVGGAYVFPGGGVDLEDGGSVAEALSRGRSDEETSSILGIERGGLAYWVAVLRELFEEAGILLASRVDGRPLELMGETAQRFVDHRNAVNAKAHRFLDVIAEEELSLDVESLHYFSHWITPVGAPRRYDTRFFVATAPARQVAVHDDGEVVAAEWITPRDALRRHRQGSIELLFPTIRNLQAISRFECAEELVKAAESAGSVPAILPRITVTGEAVRIFLPGDEGYEEAFRNAAAPSGAAQFNDAVRWVAAAANRGSESEPGS